MLPGLDQEGQAINTDPVIWAGQKTENKIASSGFYSQEENSNIFLSFEFIGELEELEEELEELEEELLEELGTNYNFNSSPQINHCRTQFYYDGFNENGVTGYYYCLALYEYEDVQSFLEYKFDHLE